ncbi:MAG: sigma-70 region 4 domain-containing protein [Clostridia bacterium]|nr:sigma-70 region 4 domain-containing protein [Clostridia bacterium]
MRTITYKFADGHIEHIEVEDDVAEVFAEIEKYEQKVDRKETRRHISLSKMLDDGFDFPDPDEDIEVIWEKQEREALEKELEEAEEERLEHKRKQLETKLTPRQAEAYFMFKYLSMKKVRIADEMGVTEGAVRKLILKAEDNLEKLRQQAIEARKERKRQKRKEAQKHKKKQQKLLKRTEEETLELRLLKALFGEN